MEKRAYFQCYPWGWGSSSPKCLQCGTYQGGFLAACTRTITDHYRAVNSAVWTAGRALPQLSCCTWLCLPGPATVLYSHSLTGMQDETLAGLPQDSGSCRGTPTAPWPKESFPGGNQSTAQSLTPGTWNEVLGLSPSRWRV